MHEVLSYIKAPSSDLKQDCLEVCLPLSLRNSLGVLHDLTGSLRLASHLEVLCILKHRHGHLL